MIRNLFSKRPEYTIDSSSLMAIFNDEEWPSKKITPGLWERVLELIEQGVIISHIEVLKEIKTDGEKGVELYDWAQEHKDIFLDYNIQEEGKIIKSMSAKYSGFVNAKVGSVHADPWLVAQAKHWGIKIITEELATASPITARWHIPNICNDPVFDISCVNLLDLSRERGWKFH